MADLKYGFLGTGTFARACLERLAEWKMPAWVGTTLPRPAGRGGKLITSPVGSLANELSIPLIETENASKDDRVLEIKKSSGVDFVFVIDFGQMIKEPLLSENECIGCLNIHPSVLPKYRGAAPIQRAIIDGETECGISIFKLARGMDSGPILLQTSFDLRGLTYGEALVKAASLGCKAFIDHAECAAIGDWSFREQDGSLATRADKISASEERIDWNESAEDIVRKIRALSPKPGAWTTIDNKRLRVINAEASSGSLTTGSVSFEGKYPVVGTASGIVELREVQMEGKKIQSADIWKNGVRSKEGVVLV